MDGKLIDFRRGGEVEAAAALDGAARLDRAGSLAAGDRGRAAGAQRRPALARGARRGAAIEDVYRDAVAETKRTYTAARSSARVDIDSRAAQTSPEGLNLTSFLTDYGVVVALVCAGAAVSVRTCHHPAPAGEVAGQRAHAGNLGRGPGGRQGLPEPPVHDHRRGRRADRDRALAAAELPDRDRLRRSAASSPARPGSSA